MEKAIPIYFDTVVIDSPAQEIPYQESKACRLHVGVFTKYKNRNGSYITDEYAEFLIKSATRGNCPVVGFFDPEEQSWATHTGPKLANGYGYVEAFDGWVPFEDTDGITREYATFSVILFTDYYEEANKIKGQHQSMELNPFTIDGDWAEFDGEEYFVYTKGDMLGLCVIGAHEPCFSVSSFFSKNDDTYKSQYEKFSSLLSDLRIQIEETEEKIKGREQLMNDEENVVVEPQEPEVNSEPEAATSEPENTTEFEAAAETPAEETQPAEEEETTPSEFEVLQQAHEELQNSHNALQTQFNEISEQVSTLHAQVEALQNERDAVQAEFAAYRASVENEKKASLIEKYTNILSEEEIKPIQDNLDNFSLDALESKLAITYANKQMAGQAEPKKVPLPEPEKSSFALLIEKYRK